MNFRAILGRDLAGSLESCEHTEVGIDRIAAFSKSPRLGSHLWRLKYGLDASVYKSTVELLAWECRIDTEQGRKLAGLVIREWLDPLCEWCQGTKELIANDKRIVCPRCQGLGLKRHSDHARARQMDMSVEHWRRMGRLYKRVLEALTRAERRVSSQMHVELER